MGIDLAPCLSMHSSLPSAWATARDACTHLGVSERTLSRWRAAGLLKPGEHRRSEVASPNSPVVYRLTVVAAALAGAAVHGLGELQ